PRAVGAPADALAVRLAGAGARLLPLRLRPGSPLDRGPSRDGRRSHAVEEGASLARQSLPAGASALPRMRARGQDPDHGRAGCRTRYRARRGHRPGIPQQVAVWEGSAVALEVYDYRT